MKKRQGKGRLKGGKRREGEKGDNIKEERRKGGKEGVKRRVGMFFRLITSIMDLSHVRLWKFVYFPKVLYRPPPQGE